jgi:hypothetical protein
MPAYTRRHTFNNPDREDYVIRCEGLDIGRVYLASLPDGERYCWFIYINGHVPQVPGVPISGATGDTRRGQQRVQAQL